jgi:hypothetical protein
LTPLAKWLANWLPARLVGPTLAVIYAALFFAVFWRLNEGLVQAIPYLDVGRG